MWTGHEVWPRAFTHAVGFIQSYVETEEKLKGFAPDGSGSREELLTAGEAQLCTNLLQDQTIGERKEERFLLIPVVKTMILNIMH